EVGIPYTLQGSRRFYKRHEVVVATALLTAIARPHDPVGVLGVLRSALSEARDRDILTFLEPDGTSLDYRDPVTGHGPVQRTLRWLADLHARVSVLPVDAALELLLDLDDWKVAEGSGYEGAQRLANLERLLTTLRRIGPADLDEAAEFAARRTAQETDDEESPLFDQDLDAVSIMTVHAAKGLEFDTVIVPDLARTAQSGGGLRTHAEVTRVFAQQGELIGVRVGSTRNAASLWIQTERRRHEDAEECRLFYVAATRAKRRLVMIRSTDKGKKGSWQSRIEELSALPSTTVDREIEVESVRPIDSDPQAASLGATLAAWRAHEEFATPPSRPIPTEPAESVTPSLFDHPPTTSREDATAFGTAVHRYLALADLAEAFDAALCSRLAIDGDEARLCATLERFHDSEFLARIRGADRVRREFPVAHHDPEHGLVHGVLDLLLDEGGHFTIVDHKTDRVPDGRHELAARAHEPQVARYAESVRRALDLPERPSTAIYFVRDDVLVEL
ncbi:MAG: PD-(D/E)XK nuclease family protein, partial [Planctomycetes bacterium]|nr:PD-(D/E)XK nuclease family protein [Planctomycetota bacterium]